MIILTLSRYFLNPAKRDNYHHHNIEEQANTIKKNILKNVEKELPPAVALDWTAPTGRTFSWKLARSGGVFRSVSVGNIRYRYRGALTLKKSKESQNNNKIITIKHWNLNKTTKWKEYVCGVGRSAEWKEWKDLSVGTGIEPQRNPTGLGVAISKVPTQRSSPEFSEFDDEEDDFAIGTYRKQ